MKIAFSLAIVLIAATDVCASAWAQPRGGTYAKLSSEQAFLYVEHGVADRLTLIGSISGGILKSTNRFVEQKTTGIGDAIVGAQCQLVDQPLVLSTMASIKIPTGYHDTHEPPLGTGDIDVETRLLVAKSLYPLPVYMGVESRASLACRAILKSISRVRRNRCDAARTSLLQGLRRLSEYAHRRGRESRIGRRRHADLRGRRYSPGAEWCPQGARRTVAGFAVFMGSAG